MAWQYFYNGAIRKYIIMFGRMFNDIKVARYGSDGSEVQSIFVPIAYGPSEKYLQRIFGDPNLDKQVSIQLPRLSFELINMTYAPNRALNKTIKNTNIGTSADSLSAQYTPIPYDFTVSLYGMFANNEDAVQVAEQIAPFFRPEWTQSLKLIPEIGDYYDIPTVLNDMSIEDTYDSDFESRRAILYTWNFTVKGYLFGPVSNKGVIKRTIVDISNNKTADPIGTKVGPDKRIVLIAGVDSDGNPTANTDNAIPYQNVNVEDNWDYAFDSIDYFDGVERHGH